MKMSDLKKIARVKWRNIVIMQGKFTRIKKEQIDDWFEACEGIREKEGDISVWPSPPKEFA